MNADDARRLSEQSINLEVPQVLEKAEKAIEQAGKKAIMEICPCVGGSYEVRAEVCRILNSRGFSAQPLRNGTQIVINWRYARTIRTERLEAEDESNPVIIAVLAFASMAAFVLLIVWLIHRFG
jgi:hypothetical protein